RFMFVRDGFHFWAFVLAPLWLLLHGLWLAFVICGVAYGLIGIGLALLGASAIEQFLAGFLIALLIGFEAPSIWRWTLTRRGWVTLGFVVGEDAEIAEQRFFTEWAKTRISPPAAAAPLEPRYSSPMRRGPPSPSDVVGLFPEPGAQRRTLPSSTMAPAICIRLLRLSNAPRATAGRNRRSQSPAIPMWWRVLTALCCLESVRLQIVVAASMKFRAWSRRSSKVSAKRASLSSVSALACN